MVLRKIEFTATLHVLLADIAIKSLDFVFILQTILWVLRLGNRTGSLQVIVFERASYFAELGIFFCLYYSPNDIGILEGEVLSYINLKWRWIPTHDESLYIERMKNCLDENVSNCGDEGRRTIFTEDRFAHFRSNMPPTNLSWILGGGVACFATPLSTPVGIAKWVIECYGLQ